MKAKRYRFYTGNQWMRVVFGEGTRITFKNDGYTIYEGRKVVANGDMKTNIMMIERI